jgi:hypothetical protein
MGRHLFTTPSLLMLASTVGVVGASVWTTPASIVADELIANYGSVASRPGVLQWPHSTDNVTFQVGIDMLHNINQVTQQWSINGYFRTWWRDPRLAFNATLAGTDAIQLTFAQSQKIWQPQLFLYQLVTWSEIKQSDGMGESLTVYSDGSVWRSEQRYVKLACRVNLKKLPYDTQTCGFNLGLYTNTADEVTLSWKEGEGVEAFDGWSARCPSGWSPVAHNFHAALDVFPSGSYSSLYATIDFARANSREMVVQYCLIASVLVCLSYLGFFINPAATPARVALGIITILSVLSNWTALGRTLPPGAGSTWLSEYLLTSLFFNVAAFVEQVAVNFGRSANEWVQGEEAKQAKQAKQVASAQNKKRDGEAGQRRERDDTSTRREDGEEMDEEMQESNISASARQIASASDATKANVGLFISAISQEAVQPELQEDTPASASLSPPPSPPSQTQVEVGVEAKSSGMARWEGLGTRMRRGSSSIAMSSKNVLEMGSNAVSSGSTKVSGAAWGLVLFKRWVKMPLLRFIASMRFLDVYCRFIYPFVYIAVVLHLFGEVNFGRDWEASIARSQC